METYSAGSLLVVDDDVDMLEVFPPALDCLGARVTTVSSGEQALRLVAENDYAAIILDVNMNVMDGYEAAKRIREVERSHTTPIIFITGGAFDEPGRRLGYRAGGVDYLMKPLDLDVLLAKLRVFLDLDSALRQIGLANDGLKRKVDELGNALAKGRALHGQIPICAYCHKIRDEAQAWQVLEAYITERSDAKFSHGICPGCHATHIEDDIAN